MKKPNIILIGGGGHCKSCIDVIELENKYKILGIIDLPKNIGNQILGYPIIGSDKDLAKFSSKCEFFLITLGQIKSSNLRKKLFDQVKSLNKKLPTITSPLAYVSKHATVSEGCIIMHDVIINAGSSIGENCIINTKAIIEHDTKIGQHCHISTMSIINGSVNIGKSCTIGSNSSISNNINITNNVIVGLGSIVIRDINEAGTYVGTPVKTKLN